MYMNIFSDGGGRRLNSKKREVKRVETNDKDHANLKNLLSRTNILTVFQRKENIQLATYINNP